MCYAETMKLVEGPDSVLSVLSEQVCSDGLFYAPVPHFHEMSGRKAMEAQEGEGGWMRRNWLYSFTISLLFWVCAKIAWGEDISSVPVNVVNPLVGWESQIKDLGSLGIVVLVVKWFMGHIEALHAGYIETIKNKDEQYILLANACREENRHLTQLVLTHIGSEGDKKR